MKPFFYVANWKMNQSLVNARAFIQEAKQEYTDTSLSPTKQLIICPSFPHLGLLAPELKDTPFALGAQTCSSHSSGAYTGQVAASTLAEVGCTYCLIGHSERRISCGETNTIIMAQYHQLVNTNITPIVCIGETEKERAMNATTDILEQQLLPLIKIYQENPATTLLLAYEPLWAIGTGKAPTNEELTSIFSWLKKRLQKNLPENMTFLLYGGSVNEITSPEIKKINDLDGLLIGNASLNFKNFKNIVV